MHHQYKENTKIVLNSQQNIINEHSTLSLQLPLVYQYCHARLDTINVEDIDENISSLNNVIDCDVIACRISEEFCESCNDYAIDIFNKAIKNFDSKHVVFLISCKSHRNFWYNVNKQYKISDYKAYLVDDDLFAVRQRNRISILHGTGQRCQNQRFLYAVKNDTRYGLKKP